MSHCFGESAPTSGRRLMVAVLCNRPLAGGSARGLDGRKWPGPAPATVSFNAAHGERQLTGTQIRGGAVGSCRPIAVVQTSAQVALKQPSTERSAESLAIVTRRIGSGFGSSNVRPLRKLQPPHVAQLGQHPWWIRDQASCAFSAPNTHWIATQGVDAAPLSSCAVSRSTCSIACAPGDSWWCRRVTMP